MNEVSEYDPESYHPSLTQSVYATLEGSCLRLDTPHSNISRKATYDERVHEVTFVRSRCFHMAHSKVWLFAQEELGPGCRNLDGALLISVC